MQIRVISLKKSADRRYSLERQFNATGVDFRFFDAIDGDEGAGSFRQLDSKRFLINTGRPVSPGEIGCYASHKAVWQQCIAGSEPFLIVEDDACLQPNFLAALAAVEKLILACGFVRLQGDVRRKKRMTKIADSGEFEL